MRGDKLTKKTGLGSHLIDPTFQNVIKFSQLPKAGNFTFFAHTVVYMKLLV